MHSLILELTRERVNKDGWVGEIDLREDHEIDYARKLEGDERDEAIRRFYTTSWLGTFLQRGEEPDTLVYKRGLASAKDEWYSELHKLVSEAEKSRTSDLYSLRQTIDYPFGGFTRYVLSDWSGTSYSCPTRELLELLDEMKIGDKLYINSVFDYHW